MHGETRSFEGADGVRLVADVHADPAQPAVVFLHGGGQTRHAWGGCGSIRRVPSASTVS
jgi:non-heme chloroperoxidase